MISITGTRGIRYRYYRYSGFRLGSVVFHTLGDARLFR